MRRQELAEEVEQTRHIAGLGGVAMVIRLGVAVIGAFALASCHATVTLRYDVHENGTVTVSVREVLDDQLYQFVESRGSGNDNFQSAQQAGWTVARTVDENDNHIITMSKTLTWAEFHARSTVFPVPRSASVLPVVASAITQTRGLFTDRESFVTTIPALMPSAPSDADNPWATAGAEMATSVISLQLQLKTPGKVISTNGETMPDGAVQWDVAVQGPTTIQYEAQTADVPHILLAVLLGLVVIAGATIAAMRIASRH